MVAAETERLIRSMETEIAGGASTLAGCALGLAIFLALVFAGSLDVSAPRPELAMSYETAAAPAGAGSLPVASAESRKPDGQD